MPAATQQCATQLAASLSVPCHPYCCASVCAREAARGAALLAEHPLHASVEHVGVHGVPARQMLPAERSADRSSGRFLRRGAVVGCEAEECVFGCRLDLVGGVEAAEAALFHFGADVRDGRRGRVRVAARSCARARAPRPTVAMRWSGTRSSSATEASARRTAALASPSRWCTRPRNPSPQPRIWRLPDSAPARSTSAARSRARARSPWCAAAVTRKAALAAQKRRSPTSALTCQPGAPSPRRVKLDPNVHKLTTKDR